MKSNKRLKGHLQKAYDRNESARGIIYKELENETDEDKRSILVQFKLHSIDVKLKLKGMLEQVDDLL